MDTLHAVRNVHSNKTLFYAGNTEIQRTKTDTQRTNSK